MTRKQFELQEKIAKAKVAFDDYHKKKTEPSSGSRGSSSSSASSSGNAASSSAPVSLKKKYIGSGHKLAAPLNEGVGYTTAEVAALLPPGGSCSLETAWHHRWKVAYPCPQRGTSKIFGGRLTVKEAVNFIVHWAWRQHVLLHPSETCPFVLEDVLA